MIFVDISQPIIPAKSAAGIRLGTNIGDLSESVDLGKGDSLFDGCTNYEFLNGIVSIAVHNNSGKIFRISIYEGYKGFLFERLKPGMPIDSLLKSSDWMFDDAEERLLHKIHSGVIVMSDLEDPLSENELHGKNIFEIAVSVNNVNSLDRDWKN